MYKVWRCNAKTNTNERSSNVLPLHPQTWQSCQALQLLPIRFQDLGRMAHYSIPIEENMFGLFCFNVTELVSFHDGGGWVGGLWPALNPPIRV